MSSFKIDKFLNKDELPEFFRQLADALEKGGKGELACAEDFRKLKISVRDEFGQVSLRTKIKTVGECQPDVEMLEADKPVAPGKPRYKDLKKRMGNSFKVLFKMIHQGKVPPKDAVESFLADSELMVSYAGYGDPYYDVYMAACADFAKAYETGDITQLNDAVDALVHQKGHCHAKYK
ncbi:GAK system XXXCH domain-containing protein [Pseudodesulfovibrio sp.]|nr:GAK system XXXCH domain-containing protein [Pseudodesulfovibrio sp.]